MALYLYTGKLLVDSGALAIHQDCCCNVGDCEECVDKIQGVLLEVAGAGSNDPATDCCGEDGSGCCACSYLNGSFFIPWTGPPTYDACASLEEWAQDDEACPEPAYEPDHILQYASYVIDSSGPPNLLTIHYNLTAYADLCQAAINGSCSIPVDDLADITCVGLTCTDNSPSITSNCDGSGASVKATIV